MGIKIMDGNIEREVVKIACPLVEGNDQGFYLGYRDAMREDETEFGAEDGAAFARMNKAQLVEALTERGVALAGDETKAELLVLAEGL